MDIEAPSSPTIAAETPSSTPLEALAQAGGGTLLTAAALAAAEAPATPEATPAEPAKPEEPKEVDLTTLVPEAPEGYQLDIGENGDKELLAMYQAKAHEMGLTQAQFGKAAELFKQINEEHVKKQDEAMFAAKAAWEKQITSSPTFEADLAHSQRAMAKFGSPELSQLMDDTMVGSFPVFFNFMSSVGKALGEDKLIGATAAAAPKSAAETLYPNQGK